MKAKFYTPVVTAFNRDRTLDIQANKNIYDHLINGGVDGIVVMGSTGEFFALTTEQKKELIDLAVSYIDHRVEVFIGTSCMNVDDTVELANYAHNAGADAVMIISPYYFSLSEESIELYYNMVASRTDAKIYLYNFPDRTGYDLSPEVTLRLARQNKNIIGYKDTVFEMRHTRKLIQTMKDEFPEFVVLSGFDEFFVHNVLCGGGGCIGGLSNLAPEICSELARAVNNKDFDRIAEYEKRIDILMELYDIGKPFIPTLKRAMTLRNIGLEDYSAYPHMRPSIEQTEQILKVMKAAGVDR